MKATKLRRYLKKPIPLLCTLLAVLLFVGGVPISVLGEVSNNAAGSEDMSDRITWSDGKLEVDTDGEWVEIKDSSTSEFAYGNYQFTISWKADKEQSYQAGDYFTFTVPAEFANLTLDLIAEDGTVFGEILIDEKGSGTATFTDKVEELEEISGDLSFEGTYSESEENVQVNWEFIFSNDVNYTYTGKNVANTEAENNTQAESEDNNTNADSGTDSTTIMEKHGLSTPQARANNQSQNVSDYITWSDGELKVYKDDAWVIIPPNDGTFVFPASWNYKFTISWEASSEQSYYEGDYFTFTVPSEFGNKNLVAKTEDGMVLANITISKEGSGKIVFTSEIEGLTEISGTISFDGVYREVESDKLVNWEFKFPGKIIEYEGKTEGYTPPNSWDILKGVNKQGFYYPDPNDTYNNHWQINLKLEEEQLDGTDTVTVTDTFGDGYTINEVYDHVKPGSSCGNYDSELYGFYKGNTEGYKDHAYVHIKALDWEAAREYYLKKYPDAFVEEGKYTSEMFEWAWANGTYVKPQSVEITDKGLEIVFNADDLKGKEIRIRYWYKLTALTGIEKIYNSVKVSGEGLLEEKTSVINISGNATISGIKGTKGQLLLYKQNSKETKALPGAEFKLEKKGGEFSKTATTNDKEGKLVFEELPQISGSLAGTYILTETKAPVGYEASAPIEIELDDEGKIIKITYQGEEFSIPSGSSGTLIKDKDKNKICWISEDQLALIVYNEEFSITTTKIWDDAENQQGKRPDSVKVQLYSDGESMGENHLVELNDENNWSFTWNSLPKYDENEKEIVYTVEEVEVPKGYTASYSYEDNTIKITNSYTSVWEFSFKKVSAEDYKNSLAGAKFTLTKADTEEVINDDAVSGDDGTVSFTGLESGTYILEETKAPNGYQLPTGKWKITIDEDGKITLGVVEGETAPPAIQYDGSTDTYLLGNVKNYTLPQSGSSGIYCFLVLGGLSLAIGLVRIRYMYSSK